MSSLRCTALRSSRDGLQGSSPFHSVLGYEIRCSHIQIYVGISPSAHVSINAVSRFINDQQRNSLVSNRKFKNGIAISEGVFIAALFFCVSFALFVFSFLSFGDNVYIE